MLPKPEMKTFADPNKTSKAMAEIFQKVNSFFKDFEINLVFRDNFDRFDFNTIILPVSFTAAASK